MKILNRYVCRDFFIAFFMAIGLLTFAMMGARLIPIFELVSRGIPVKAFLEFTFYTLPIVLTFTIPWSVLVATILVFGRLSADSEITAMRACGFSIIHLIAPLLLFVLGIVAICLYLQVESGPPMLRKARDTIRLAAEQSPASLFDPGHAVVYDTNIIRIDDKADAETVLGVDIFCFDDSSELKQNISAEKGHIHVDENQVMTVTLYNCTICSNDEEGKAQRVFNESISFSIDFAKKLNQEKVASRPKYMRLAQLLAYLKIVKSGPSPDPETVCELECELNMRIAMALSPIAFLLLGLPLAIRTSRRETSVGLFISVILGGAFFMAVILCESLTSFYYIYPQYLMWLPNLLYQGGGAIMLYRISQK